MPDFLRQTAKEPLFPEVLWSKPVNRKAAKSLLIIGGSKNRFQATQQTYQSAVKAGIGEARVVLPDSLRAMVGEAKDCFFVPSTPSGSIAKLAHAEIQDLIQVSDGLLLAGELTHNNDTTSLIERLLTEVTKPIVLTAEVIDSLLFSPKTLFQHQHRLLIGSAKTFMKLIDQLNIPLTIKPSGGILNKISLLEQLSEQTKANYAMTGAELIVAANGKSSVTELKRSPPLTATAAYTATYWLQHPDAFKSLTTAAFEISQRSEE